MLNSSASFRASFRKPSVLVVLSLLLLASVAIPVARGQHSMASMSGMQPIPAPSELPIPQKMTGIGNSHIAIKASPAAQAWFDQGLSLLHDFWNYESAKAFEQSIRVDPKCAMCYWGLAQALGMREDSAQQLYVKQAIEQAQTLAPYASKTDKLYIKAAAEQINAKDDDDSAGVAKLRELVQIAPHDTQARIFLSEAVRDGYDSAGNPKPGTKESIALLESALRDAPNDSAANHYWIHAIEPGNHPELALKSAALLASLAPNSGHMVHMPGHIYYRVGDYATAEHWFAASMKVDEDYLAANRVSVDDDWNYVHNLMYAIANLMEEGKLAEANTLSDHLSAARGRLSPTLYVWSARDQMARVSQRLPVALRTANWDAVLTMLANAHIGEAPNTEHLRFLSLELTEYATGMKALNAADLATAQSASDRMDAALWRMQLAVNAAAAAKKETSEADKQKQKPPAMPIMPDADAAPLLKSLAIASQELRAGILAGQGKLDEAKKLYAQAIDDERRLGYHEPPFYIRPVGENEAEALIRAKDYAGAKAAYEVALKERPNSGFALYGLAYVAELSGDRATVRTAYTSFLKAWSAADPNLPELEHAHRFTSETVAAR